MSIIENQFNNLISVVNQINNIVEFEDNNVIYGNFIFKKIELDTKNFHFRFIIPNKVAITILYSEQSNQILLHVKNYNVIEGRLYELFLSKYAIYLLEILKNLNLKTKYDNYISYYIFLNLIYQYKDCIDVKNIFIHKMNTDICIKIFNILQESFIKTS